MASADVSRVWLAGNENGDNVTPTKCGRITVSKRRSFVPNSARSTTPNVAGNMRTTEKPPKRVGNAESNGYSRAMLHELNLSLFGKPYTGNVSIVGRTFGPASAL